MTTNDTYLAVFLGSKTSPKMKAWNSLPEGERRAKEREGIAAWKAWVEKHQGAIVAMGGPLGKTKKITQRGIEDMSNDMGAFTVVRAESNEAAAKLFENHHALHNLPWRSRGGNAGLAHTWCLICGSARETANRRTVRERANTIALTEGDVAHKGAHDISLRRILTDLHAKGGTRRSNVRSDH